MQIIYTRSTRDRQRWPGRSPILFARSLQVSPAKRNKGRMGAVQNLFLLPDLPQYLRRTVICLQLTGRLHAFCARKPREGDEPLMVRLAKGEARLLTRRDVANLLLMLHHDPALDVGACVSALLATAMDLVLRFRLYERAPWTLCELRAAFGKDRVNACLAFLSAERRDLDEGLGYPLQQFARGLGSEALALNFLLSEDVQTMLQKWLEATDGSSLPVERLHAETKRNEQSRLLHVAVASRNQNTRVVHRMRERAIAELDEAEADLKRAKKTGIYAIAWERSAEHVGTGPCVGGPERQRLHALEENQRQLGALGELGTTAAGRAYVADHREELKAERTRRLNVAKTRLKGIKKSFFAVDA